MEPLVNLLQKQYSLSRKEAEHAAERVMKSAGVSIEMKPDSPDEVAKKWARTDGRGVGLFVGQGPWGLAQAMGRLPQAMADQAFEDKMRMYDQEGQAKRDAWRKKNPNMVEFGPNAVVKEGDIGKTTTLNTNAPYLIPNAPSEFYQPPQVGMGKTKPPVDYYKIADFLESQGVNREMFEDKNVYEVINTLKVMHDAQELKHTPFKSPLARGPML